VTDGDYITWSRIVDVQTDIPIFVDLGKPLIGPPVASSLHPYAGTLHALILSMKLHEGRPNLLLFILLADRPADAAAAHTVRGVVITTDGTVVPEFTITVKHAAQKPELLTRKRFKNGEFTINGLTKDKYQLRISAAAFH